MRFSALFTTLLLTSFSGFSQNILEAIQLQEASFGAYMEGETRATDTLIDLKNGYYEEFLAYDDDNKTITRQASIFHNHDGSGMLGVSITQWDFVCFHTETNFYEIAESKDSIHAILKDDILPDLNIREFVTDSNAFNLLGKYLPQYQETYTDTNATIDAILSQVYSIVYRLPQRGTDLIATLKVCDYLPLKEVDVGQDNWSIFENSFLAIELEYDKKQKKFKRKNAIKK
ncbi:MAG: hypothetical protein ACI97P_000092 [Arcticibacterium sp.]|jgi:hypothetical protein